MSTPNPSSKPKNPAASHMLWFFVIPCLGFVLWASWNLMGSVLKPKPQDLNSRLERVRDARSSGDRWQSVYALSQELTRMRASGEWEKALSPEQKTKLFEDLTALARAHKADLRFQKYVLLTLGQFGDLSTLTFIKESFAQPDDELKFYSALSYLEILSRFKDKVAAEDLNQVVAWLDHKEASFRKIAASFLVQQHKPEVESKVEKLLKDSDLEVRWNAAVALGSVKNAKAAVVLREMFELSKIRDLGLRSVDDLKQLLASAAEAAVKLGDQDVIAAARKLVSDTSATTPEGRAIHETLGKL